MIFATWTWVEIIGAIAGIITALGGVGAVSAITTYLLERRRTALNAIKLEQEHEKKRAELELREAQQNLAWQTSEFSRLSGRIDDLEGARDECLTKCAEKDRIIGQLEGKLSGIENVLLKVLGVKESAEQTAKLAVEAVSEQAHEVAAKVVEEVATKAVTQAISANPTSDHPTDPT